MMEIEGIKVALQERLNANLPGVLNNALNYLCLFAARSQVDILQTQVC